MRPCVWWQTSIPGGLTKGGGMYFCAGGVTFPDGDKVDYGQLGTVMGPPTLAGTKGQGLENYTGKAVDMKFPGNKGTIACPLTSLSRDPPVLVGCGVKSCVESVAHDPLGSCLGLAACVSCGCGRRWRMGEWDGIGMGSGSGWIGWDRIGRDGIGSDGIGWDRMRWDRVGWVGSDGIG